MERSLKLCQRCKDEGARPFDEDSHYGEDITIVPEPGCEFYLHKRINSAYKIFDEKARREFHDHLSGTYTAEIESQYFEEAMGRLRGNYE